MIGAPTVIPSVALLSLLLTVGCRPQPTPPADTDAVRIVSLAPSLTEMVVAIGAEDALVGRTSACDYPEDVIGDIPVVGGFGRPSIETLLAMSPTVIIDTDLEDESMAARFTSLGIRHVRIRCKGVADIPAGIRTLGDLSGREEAAEKLAAEVEQGMEAARAAAQAATNAPGVYVEIWHDPLMTAGRHTYLTELIELAGGKNIAGDVDQEYFRVSPEFVLTQNPDVMLCAYMASGQDVSEMVRKRQGWGEVRAIKTGALFCNENNDILLRPGPRVLEGIEALKRCIARSQTE